MIKPLGQYTKVASSRPTLIVRINLTQSFSPQSPLKFITSLSQIISFFISSGRSAHRLSLDYLKKEGISKENGHKSLPADSVHCITVPGAAAGWVDTVSKFGSGKVR